LLAYCAARLKPTGAGKRRPQSAKLTMPTEILLLTFNDVSSDFAEVRSVIVDARAIAQAELLGIVETKRMAA
jgi:hypothetical protein